MINHEDCTSCPKSGNCAIEDAGGIYGAMNDEEKKKITGLYKAAMPQVAAFDAIASGYVKKENGKFVKSESSISSDDEFIATVNAASFLVLVGAALEKIFTEAIERIENEKASTHNLTTEKRMMN